MRQGDDAVHIGACLITCALSGGAFNPIRVLAPALFVNRWHNIWVYFLAQFTGAGLGAGLRHVFTMCQQRAEEEGDVQAW